MVDTHASEACSARCGGSSPLLGTRKLSYRRLVNLQWLWFELVMPFKACLPHGHQEYHKCNKIFNAKISVTSYSCYPTDYEKYCSARGGVFAPSGESSVCEFLDTGFLLECSGAPLHLTGCRRP